jgi:hypothetical protein
VIDRVATTRRLRNLAAVTCPHASFVIVSAALAPMGELEVTACCSVDKLDDAIEMLEYALADLRALQAKGEAQ